MKLRNLIFLIGISLTNSMFSQNFYFDWATKTGSTGNDAVSAIDHDQSGNIIEAGYFSGTVDFDPGSGTSNLSSSGAYDIFVRKLDFNGNLLWAVKAGGTGNDVGWDVAVDSAGSVYVTGYFINSVDFDPGTGTSNQNGGTAGSPFVWKLNSTGSFAWVAALTGGSTLNEGRGIAIDANGNPVVCGIMRSSFDADPGSGTTTLNIASSGQRGFIIKLNGAGSLVWAKNLEGANASRCWSVAIGNNNSILIGGNFLGTVDFDPNSGVQNISSVNSMYDIFVERLDASGNYVWVSDIGGTGDEDLWAITTDAAGNVYATGSYGGSVDFDPGAGTFTLNSTLSTWDIYVFKLNSNGNFGWAAGAGSNNVDFGNAIDVDQNGYVYIAGSYKGLTDFDPGSGTQNLGVVGVEDAFIWCLTPSGTFYAVSRIGSTGLDQFNGIDVSYFDCVRGCGQFAAAADFDPGTGTNTITPSSTRDGFTFQWVTCTAAPTAPGTITGSSSICQNSTNTYSVSPVAGASNYVWSLPGGWSGSSTSNSITVTAGLTGGTISVSAANSCGTSTNSNLAVIVNNAPPSPASVIGSASICLNTVNTYSVTAIPTATSYTWTLPGGWSGTSTTNSISATSGNNGGNISVTANNSCGSSAPVTFSVTVNQAPTAPSSVAGAVTVCENSTNSYSITSVPGATSYTWTLPNGWSGSSTGTGIMATAGTNNGTITVTANNNCGSSSAAALPVSVNTIPVIIYGPDDTICAGQSTVFVTSTSGNSIYWYYDTVSMAPFDSANFITTGPLFNSTTYYVSAANNGCPTPLYPVTCVVNPMPATTVNITSGYIESDQVGATAYQWLNCDSNMIVIAGQNNQQYFPPSSGNYAVIVDLNGCIDTSSCGYFTSVDINEHASIQYNIYPNPVADKLTVNSVQMPDQLIISDLTGRVVLSVVQTREANTETLASGNYLLTIIEGNQVHVTRFIKQ